MADSVKQRIKMTVYHQRAAQVLYPEIKAKYTFYPRDYLRRPCTQCGKECVVPPYDEDYGWHPVCESCCFDMELIDGVDR